MNKQLNLENRKLLKEKGKTWFPLPSPNAILILSVVNLGDEQLVLITTKYEQFDAVFIY